MENRVESPRIAEIAAQLIETDCRLQAVKDSGVKIAYLESDRERYSSGRAVYGECERVPSKYRWAIPFEFTITVYTPHVEALDDTRMRILVLHELMHVGCELDGHAWRYRIIPHDVEDFRSILEEHGLDWIS